jgi:hypothetical protein
MRAGSTRTSALEGRLRRMTRLITVEIPPAPQPASWKSASSGKPRTSKPAARAGGMMRDCGGNPGHETISMSRLNQR